MNDDTTSRGRVRSGSGVATRVLLFGIAAIPVVAGLSGCVGEEPDALVERLDQVADTSTSDALKKVFESYGGYDLWRYYHNIECVYDLEVYGRRKTVVARTRQLQRFGLHDEPRAYIEDLDVEFPRVIRLDGEEIDVTLDGVPVTDPAELRYPEALGRIARWNLMNPWNLVGPGAALEMRSNRIPPSSGALPADPCYVVRLRTEVEGDLARDVSGDWHDFYFSQLSGLVDRVHSYRSSDQSFRLSIWSDHRNFDGIRVATVRKIYISDEFGMINRLEAVARYGDVEFDAPFGDEIFSAVVAPLAASAGGE